MLLYVPPAVRPLVSRFSVAFTRPTFQRFVLLMVGFVLAPRQRTVTAALRALGSAAAGHFSSFHRVLSRRVWRPLALGRVLAAIVLELVPRDQPVVAVVDDTATQHKGDHVWGKGLHRDACRSTKNFQVWLWGHRWLVLAVSVRLPFSSRPWALPVLCALYRPKELDEREKRRQKTPIDWARQLMALLIRWFPERRFVLVGDGAFACHELAHWCWRRRKRVTLVSRFRGDANLYAPPPAVPAGRKVKGGRPRVKGDKLAPPAEVVAGSPGERFTVAWYGGGTRQVSLVWGEGGWYRGEVGLTPVRWVHVHDLSGTHRDEYFFSTDPAMKPDEVVRLYTERWGIEVTFQEAKQRLGLGTPRNRCERSVTRTVPCLLGCFTVVCLLFARTYKRGKVRSWPWHRRAEPTFGDALASARRACWSEVLETGRKREGFSKLPPQLRAMLLDQLSLAA